MLFFVFFLPLILTDPWSLTLPPLVLIYRRSLTYSIPPRHGPMDPWFLPYPPPNEWVLKKVKQSLLPLRCTSNVLYCFSLKTNCYNFTLETWNSAALLLSVKCLRYPGTKMRSFLSFLVTTPSSSMALEFSSASLLRVWTSGFSMR